MNPEGPSKNTNNNQSCAACKFQRRKCTVDCPLAPYFPAENQRDFNHVRRLFGVANVLKITKNLDPIQRDDAMRSIVYESTVHAMDPVFGCRGVTAHLQSQIARGVAQINYARQQLVQLRMAAHQQQQRQQQQQQQQCVPMGYDGSLERGRSSAAMGRPHSAQEDQNHGVLETEQIVQLRMTAQQQQQQQQQQQYVTMGCDQQMMQQQQQQQQYVTMGCDQQMIQQQQKPQQQQQQQQQYVTMGCDQQMMPQHLQQPLEFLKEMGCDEQMMQQQQQQQQYVTMGCDEQMMPQHQQQPLEFLKEMGCEFLKEMGCDQQMMQQQQQQQQYVTMGYDQQMMPQQQQPPLEGVTMGRPHSAQEDQNHGVLETEPQNGS